MSEEFNRKIIFGDEDAVAFINKKKKENIRTKKITIDYNKLIQVGVTANQAEDLIKRLLDYKKRK